MKTILIYVWSSKYGNNLRPGLPKKMGKSKDRRWSQVNEEKLDIERDSLPAQNIIQQTKAELFPFFLVSVCFIFFKRLLKTASTECEFICSKRVSAKCDCRLDENTANKSFCFRKDLPSMFVLIYPFTSQIFCINNDIMQRFTCSEKNRDDLLQYNGINFTSRKNGSNFCLIGKPYFETHPLTKLQTAFK